MGGWILRNCWPINPAPWLRMINTNLPPKKLFCWLPTIIFKNKCRLLSPWYFLNRTSDIRCHFIGWFLASEFLVFIFCYGEICNFSEGFVKRCWLFCNFINRFNRIFKFLFLSFSTPSNRKPLSSKPPPPFRPKPSQCQCVHSDFWHKMHIDARFREKRASGFLKNVQKTWGFFKE